MMLKKLLFVIIVCFPISDCLSQDLSFRYWKLRQKLLDDFIVVGECHGCSMPASAYNQGIDWLAWLDEPTLELGWYIGVLATENYLLRQNSQDTRQNRQELYFAKM